MVRGWIGEDLGVWGPDARVELTVGVTNVNIVQHTEGRGESSNAMLALSVSGLDYSPIMCSQAARPFPSRAS